MIHLVQINNYSVAGTKNNPNLKAVKTNTQEIGLEMQFLNRRIGFEVSAYKSENNGATISSSLFNSNWITVQDILMLHTVENKGIEVQFNVTPFKTKDFSMGCFCKLV